MADLAHPELSEDDLHHLGRVLRLRSGEEVTVSDGAGGWRRCCYWAGGTLEALGAAEVLARPAPPVTVAFALTKGDRPEWTVQKLTECGVDGIVPMTTGRTVVQWKGEKASRQAARLRSVALAAAMQSRQVWLPVVSELQTFAQAVAAGGRAAIALAERGGDPPSLKCPMILVGPEGGWDETELASGLPLVELSPAVLRAETAAMAAGVLLSALRAGVVGSAGP